MSLCAFFQLPHHWFAREIFRAIISAIFMNPRGKRSFINGMDVTWSIFSLWTTCCLYLQFRGPGTGFGNILLTSVRKSNLIMLIVSEPILLGPLIWNTLSGTESIILSWCRYNQPIQLISLKTPCPLRLFSYVRNRLLWYLVWPIIGSHLKLVLNSIPW